MGISERGKRASVVVCLAVLLGACTPGQPRTEQGAALFQQHCAGCHGAEARGGGPQAAGLLVAPPDLTGLAARAGGAFPYDWTLAQIYGYPGRHHLGLMPDLGPDLGGPMVLWTTSDGAQVPTPQELMDLVQHLARLQQ